jgi:hypothetical protein
VSAAAAKVNQASWKEDKKMNGYHIRAFASRGRSVWCLGLLSLAAVAYLSAPRMGRGLGESVAAWYNIGGCGSSGGGAAAGAGKWLGRGVSGGLVDLELLSNNTVGGDYFYSAQNVSLTFHDPKLPRYTAGLSLAMKTNFFEYEGYKTAEDLTPRMTRVTGGAGDLGGSFNYIFGEANENSLGLSIGLPTGQHDIKRLHFKGQNVDPDDIRWMNPFVQPGSGLYSLGLSYEYTKTKDWGLIILGGSYSSAWAWDNWACRDGQPGTTNDKVLSCQAAGPSPLTWKLWELKHQPWGGDDKMNWSNSYGAPGTGATGADGLSMYGYVGHKDEASTQSVGLTLSIPMAPTYYWEYGPGTADSRVSTRIRTYDYTLKLSGGIEITNPNFPIFFGLGIPYKLNDVMDRGRLVEPQNYIATVGLRGTFL